jgi:Tfp pilus assembly protein PilF
MRLETDLNSTTAIDGAVVDAVVGNYDRQANEALREGVQAAQAGDRAGARTALLRATELDPSSESAWLWLASISEYPEELLIFLNNVLEINPHNGRALEWIAATKSLLAKTFVQRGIDAAGGGQADLAAQCFNQALENDQANADAWLWLAKLADSPEGKLTYLEKVVEIDPSNQEAKEAYAAAQNKINQSLLAEARAAAVAGRNGDANDLLDAFISVNPESEEGWILRAHLADGFDAKIKAFEQVIAINPQNSVAASGIESLRSIMAMVAPQVEESPAT